MADMVLTDPLGRQIVLHDHTWFGHIVKGHPDMRPLRHLVEQAIQSPQFICFSASSADARIYYGAGPSPRLLIAVVADVVEGVVKTAYRTRRVKGAVEWSP